MRLFIRARNRDLQPRKFVVLLFKREPKAFAKHPGDHTIELVTTIEGTADVPPGQVTELDLEWPAPDHPPETMIFKAAPEHSLVWEMLEVRQDHKSLLTATGFLA